MQYHSRKTEVLAGLVLPVNWHMKYTRVMHQSRNGFEDVPLRDDPRTDPRQHRQESAHSDCNGGRGGTRGGTQYLSQSYQARKKVRNNFLRFLSLALSGMP
jgi:hypothetical protein